MTIINVVGARPNMMKIAPLISEMKRFPDIEQVLVHTGQHYDDNMSKIFFEDLSLPDPDVYLGVGSASRDEQIAKIMAAFESVLAEHEPDLVVVVGDVNSTLACALATEHFRKSCNRINQINQTNQINYGCRPYIAHIEAGLRSFDLTMPEEINRIETDKIADLLFTTEPSANENLKKEGIAEGRIHYVGNVMIDSLVSFLPRAEETWQTLRHTVPDEQFALVTMHRPSNVDNPKTLSQILQALCEISKDLPVIFPVHPRTRKCLLSCDLGKSGFRSFCHSERREESPFQSALGGSNSGPRPDSSPPQAGSFPTSERLILTEPLGYLDFLALESHAALVITDSGGIQEETTYLGVPCLTVRPNTERPITIEIGTNRLVSTEIDAIVSAAMASLDGSRPTGRRVPDLWDGKAAERIVAVLRQKASGVKSLL